LLWTISLPHPQATSLRLFTGTVAYPEPPEEIRLGFSWDTLKSPLLLPDQGLVLQVADLSFSPHPLDLEPPGPAYYHSVASTQGNADGDDEAGAAPGKYLDLHLWTLSIQGTDQPQGWQLHNVELRNPATSIDDWRYLRRDWRPDWGGWLGLEGHELTAEEQQATGARQGLYVQHVVPEGPAARAGLKAGDVLLTFNHEPISDAWRFGQAVRCSTPGHRVPITFLRDGQSREQSVELGSQPLWPDLDDRELREVWKRLVELAAWPETEPLASLSDWRWQSRKGVPLPFVSKTATLVFRRSGRERRTTFAFQDIPLPRPLVEP